MDQDAVRSGAAAVCDALVAGDVDTVVQLLSDELRRNPGEIVAMLPLPATEASITSVDQAPSAYVVVIRVTGETSDVELQTRWKDRRGEARIVEVSHLSQTERAAVERTEADTATGGEGGSTGGQV